MTYKHTKTKCDKVQMVLGTVCWNRKGRMAFDMKTFDPKRTNLKRQDHFSIRKFKYGVASVLIETSLLFSPGVVAKASEPTATSNPETPVLTIDDNDTTTASSSQELSLKQLKQQLAPQLQ